MSKMPRYCFIANYHLTPVFISIAKGLAAQGIDTLWIVANSTRHEEILRAGWTTSQILHLPLDVSTTFEPFQRFPIKVFDLLTADRALRHTPVAGIAYLNASAHRIVDFLQCHRPDFVFGETTWAHERLIAQLCESIGNINFLCPHTIRQPAGRWGFFLGEDQASLYERDVHTNPDAESPLGQVEFRVTQPTYVKRNDELIARASSVRGRLARVKRFLTRENIDTKDPTNIQSRLATFRVAGAEELNRWRYRFTPKTTVTPEVLARPFVLYALHKQPESSIDVQGRYYEDQGKLIHAIWRTLPVGWWLYVKEHTNAIGDRSRHFYRQLLALPQVALVDEQVPASTLISACQAVFTVSGTVAYEAALLGRRAFTFAPMFFNRFPSCSRINIDDLRSTQDMRHLIEVTHSSVPMSDPRAYILRNSFVGRYSDCHSDPSVLEPENIRRLIDGFASLVVRA